MSRHQTRRRGFTLVELLLVLVILGLAATIVGVRFSDSLTRARIDEAVLTWQRIDTHARAAARTQELVLRLENAGDSQTIFLDTVSGNQLRTWQLPVDVELASLNGQRIAELRYWRSGGSVDYRVTVRNHSYERRLLFAGGTGHVMPQ
jgi:prepilin-type N-terminal cleavage/methylation domain-containing protein